MIENENTAPPEAPQPQESTPPAVADPVVQADPVPPVEAEKPAESGAHAVLTEIENGLEALAAFPENVLAWLRAKLAEVRSHL